MTDTKTSLLLLSYRVKSTRRRADQVHHLGAPGTVMGGREPTRPIRRQFHLLIHVAQQKLLTTDSTATMESSELACSDPIASSGIEKVSLGPNPQAGDRQILLRCTAPTKGVPGFAVPPPCP